MELIFIVFIGASGIIIGRLLLRSWFNHLVLYSILWTPCLILYTFRLINYYPISFEAWIYIYLSWFMLYLGSIMFVYFMKISPPQEKSALIESIFKLDSCFLTKMIILLCLLSALGIVYTFISIMRTFGSVGAILLQASQLYEMRLAQKFEVIPYLSSLPIAASCLAGLYTAIKKKVTFLALLPIFLIAINSMMVMGRGVLIIAVTIFITTLYYTPHPRFINTKMILGFLGVMMVTLGTFTLISSIRHAFIKFRFEEKEMQSIRSIMNFSPSIYFYLSAPPVGFSEYIYWGREDVFPGSYTFRPVFNILSKVGLAEAPPLFSPFVPTPEPINTGTYLREIYTDFGPWGIMLFPFFLSILLTFLVFRVKYKPTAKTIVLLAHFFAIIWLSWDVNTTKLGEWAVSLLICILIAHKLDLLNKTIMPIKFDQLLHRS